MPESVRETIARFGNRRAARSSSGVSVSWVFIIKPFMLLPSRENARHAVAPWRRVFVLHQDSISTSDDRQKQFQHFTIADVFLEKSADHNRDDDGCGGAQHPCAFAHAPAQTAQKIVQRPQEHP